MSFGSGVTLEGIDQAIEDLGYRSERSAKKRLVRAIRSRYQEPEDVDSIRAVDPEDLIRNLWGGGDGSGTPASRKRNLSSLRSSINSDLMRLFRNGGNPEGVIIGPSYTFVLSDEAKDQTLELLGSMASPDGRPDPVRIQEVLKGIQKLLAGMDREEAGDKTMEALKAMIKDLAGSLGLVGPDSIAGGAAEGGNGPDAGAEEVEVLEEDVEEEAEEDEGVEDEEVEDEEVEEEEGPLEDQAVEVMEEDVPEEGLEDSDELPEEAAGGAEAEAEAEEVPAGEIEEGDLEEVEVLEGENDPGELEEEGALEDREVEVLEEELEEEAEGDEEVEEEEGPLEDDAVEVVEEDVPEEGLEDSEELPEEAAGGAEAAGEAGEVPAGEIEEGDLEEVEVLEGENDPGELEEEAGGEGRDQGLSPDWAVPEMDPGGEVDVEKKRLLAEEFNQSLAAMDRFYNRHIRIPGGEYRVGSPSPSRIERKEAVVRVDGFYIGKFPVTNALFELFVERTGYRTTAERAGYGIVHQGRFQRRVDDRTGRKEIICRSGVSSSRVEGACWYQPSGPGGNLRHKRNHPVVQVSLEDALAFAAWCGKRLPTEEEWEAAMRTDKGLRFPWGEDWVSGACNVEKSFLGDTSPVDRYAEYENPLGVADCLGNVLEWTMSREEGGRVLKGGSWLSNDVVSLWHRKVLPPETASNITGFRCVAY